jgi:hypothetical protein
MMMSRVMIVTGLMWLAGAAAPASGQARRIDLTGVWQFQADPGDAGVAEGWYLRTLAGAIRLPGSMAENGLGDDIAQDTKWTGGIVDRSWFTAPEYARYRQPGNVKVPFWLNPVKVYLGPAWYRRDVDVPPDWEGQRIVLELERCHWETRLWVDGREVGLRNSLGTPHVYDLSGRLSPGRHSLTLRIDNRIKDIDVGENAHSVSDHTQTNWNGVIGRLSLSASSLVFIDDVQVFPDVRGRSASLRADVRNQSGRPFAGVIVFRVRSLNDESGAPAPVTVAVSVGKDISRIEAAVALGDKARLWDEFSPNLYELTAELSRAGTEPPVDAATVRFGLREFRPQGTRFAINGRPVFLRGTLECCVFPKTGYPAMSAADWRRIFAVCRAHGLNHVRFHSWCPPEAAFAAADELGIYLYVECCSWTAVGDGMPFDRWLYEESERIVRAYGNHPSFCMMSYGNEPSGKNQAEFLGKFVDYWKTRDGRRVYTGASGWPQIPANEFHSTGEPRIQRWGEGLKSVINSRPPRTDFDFRDILGVMDRPVVGHEVGQWCVYPNLAEIPKYTGVLRAGNFEIFRDTLEAAGMGALAPDFLTASGKLQALCYKADIEAALRTPGFAGFELLDLHDFPGQGTALVGILDAFWDEKGYIGPAEFRRFCAPTVPLARLAKRVFSTGEALAADIEVAHFGPAPLRRAPASWTIADAAGNVVRRGEWPALDANWGNGIPVGRVAAPLAGLAAPARYRLAVRVAGFENDWSLWVYPESLPRDAGAEVRVVPSLDGPTAALLEAGGRVILTLPKGSLRPEKGGDVAVGFSSIFWNTSWTAKQPPHTLGILCDPRHPALAEFPTEAWSDWQWWDAMSHAQAVLLSDFGSGFTPIVRVIDDWFTNRPLGLVFEVSVGQGRLIVSGVDLLADADKRPEARQLLHSLKRYAASEAFRPAVRADLGLVRGLLR